MNQIQSFKLITSVASRTEFPSPLAGEGGGEGRSSEIGIWNLFGICNLEFGI